jgi:hypothetical protein
VGTGVGSTEGEAEGSGRFAPVVSGDNSGGADEGVGEAMVGDGETVGEDFGEGIGEVWRSDEDKALGSPLLGVGDTGFALLKDFTQNFT